MTAFNFCVYRNTKKQKTTQPDVSKSNLDNSSIPQPFDLKSSPNESAHNILTPGWVKTSPQFRKYEFKKIMKFSIWEFSYMGVTPEICPKNGIGRSWSDQQLILKHDNTSAGSSLRITLSDFLQETGERIEKLKTIHKRVGNRFNRLLAFLGMTKQEVKKTKPHEFCEMLSTFSMQYRKVFQQLNTQDEQLPRRSERIKKLCNL